MTNNMYGFYYVYTIPPHVYQIMYHITSCIDIYVLLNIKYMLFDSIQLGLLINHTKVRNTEFYKEQI